MQCIGEIQALCVQAQRLAQGTAMRRLEIGQAEQQIQGGLDFERCAVVGLEHPDKLEKDGHRCGKAAVSLQQGHSARKLRGIVAC